MTTLAEQLERLAERATPGDWHRVPYGDGQDSVICADEAGNKRIAFMAIPGSRDLATRTATWGRIRSDADLIVLMRNNLPQIIAALKAVEAEQ